MSVDSLLLYVSLFYYYISGLFSLGEWPPALSLGRAGGRRGGAGRPFQRPFQRSSPIENTPRIGGVGGGALPARSIAYTTLGGA